MNPDHATRLATALRDNPQRLALVKSIANDLMGILFNPDAAADDTKQYTPEQLAEIVAVLLTEYPVFRDPDFTRHVLLVLHILCHNPAAAK